MFIPNDGSVPNAPLVIDLTCAATGAPTVIGTGVQPPFPTSAAPTSQTVRPEAARKPRRSEFQRSADDALANLFAFLSGPFPQEVADALVEWAEAARSLASDAADDLESLMSEQETHWDNLPEAFKDAPIGRLLEDRLYACDEAVFVLRVQVDVLDGLGLLISDLSGTIEQRLDVDFDELKTEILDGIEAVSAALEEVSVEG